MGVVDGFFIVELGVPADLHHSNLSHLFLENAVEHLNNRLTIFSSGFEFIHGELGGLLEEDRVFVRAALVVIDCTFEAEVLFGCTKQPQHRACLWQLT